LQFSTNRQYWRQSTILGWLNSRPTAAAFPPPDDSPQRRATGRPFGSRLVADADGTRRLVRAEELVVTGEGDAT
jgi:hypothetical protein